MAERQETCFNTGFSFCQAGCFCQTCGGRLAFGNSPTISCVAVPTARKDSEKFEIPSWCENYLLPSEQDLRTVLRKLEEEHAALEQQINIKRNQIEDLKKSKLLFGGSGKPLEVEVKKVFEALGFTDLTDAEASPNRDDLILRYDDKIAVVEIKGIFRKSAGE